MSETGSEIPLLELLELLRQHHAESDDTDEFSFDAALTCRRAATALREQAERVAELEAENARLRADLQGAEQRVLREFAEWCESLGRRAVGQSAKLFQGRCAAEARVFARQRAQEAGWPGVSAQQENDF